MNWDRGLEIGMSSLPPEMRRRSRVDLVKMIDDSGVPQGLLWYMWDELVEVDEFEVDPKFHSANLGVAPEDYPAAINPGRLPYRYKGPVVLRDDA